MWSSNFDEISEKPNHLGVFANDATPYSSPCDHLQSFRPHVGQFADDRKLRGINNPQHMDVDAACLFMLSQDLPLLIGTIIRLDNREVGLRDFEEGFRDWMHVISDMVVVRVRTC